MLNVKSAALRGASPIALVRNEGESAAEVKKLLDGIRDEIKNRFDDQNKAWSAFKDEHGKGSKDVVSAEKVDKISAEMTKLGEEIDSLNTKLATAQIGGGPSAAITPEHRAYESAFNGKGGYMRKGAENGLQDLAVRASLNAGDGPDGGWTVPIQTETTIDRVLTTASPMRGIASVMQISGGMYRKPFNIGGMQTGWVGEQSARPQTDPSQLSLIDFPVMELYAMPAATQTLLDDSTIDIAEWLAAECGLVFAEQEGNAFVNGVGNTQPRGLLSYGTVADGNWKWGKLGYVAIGAGGALTDADGLIDLCYAPKQGYRANGRWLLNRKTEATIRKFKDQNDNYIWQPALTADSPATLLGYPISNDDNMPDVGGNKYPIAFGDFKRGYLIVDRIGIRTLRDPYSAKPYVLFYTTKRVGAGVQNFEAIKLGQVAA